MPVIKPYRRTCRQLADGSYSDGGNGQYVRDPRFASDARHYIRAFEVLQKDILELFDFIEPAHANRRCFSHRIHELHARVCMEIEANFQAILDDNGYVLPAPPAGQAAKAHPDMDDYRKLEATHRLSAYQVKFPAWRGSHDTKTPFAPWAQDRGLPWYQDYNAAQHSRHVHFEKANFRNLAEAMAGLVAVLSSQFITDDFGQLYLVAEGADDNFEYAIGGYFLVRFPRDWPVDDRYTFDWATLKNDSDAVATLTF